MKITLLLITITILAFFVPLFTVEDLNGFYTEYGFSNEGLHERPWILVTSIFLHGSLEHLISNILVWLFFGIAVEGELGRNKMLLIFFLGAFLGDGLSVFFYTSDTIFVGASAGIFALVGAGMLIRPLDMSFYPLVVPIPLALLGMAYVLFNVYAFLTGSAGNISYIGHLSGLTVGFAFGIHKVGARRGLKIMFVTFLLLILIPLIYILLF